MSSEQNKIITIVAKGVNAYLIDISKDLQDAGKKFVMIDSGFESKRVSVLDQMSTAGCIPENLDYIFLTHGDFDHIGNCAYLKEYYNTKVGINYMDRGMAENGDMFSGREGFSKFTQKLINFFLPILQMGLKKESRFKPDFNLQDGQDLSEYGFNAKVVALPGHSKGSIGILTNTGELFCGDLLENTKQPKKFSLVSNKSDFDASIEKLRFLDFHTIYPGHGTPFSKEEFLKIK